MAENNENKIDWSKVHIFTLFRQYFGVTYAAWSFQHAWYDGRIDISAEKFNESMKEYEDLTQPLFDAIMSRLGLTKDDPDHKQKFMSWYSANERFVKLMSDEEYHAFELVEREYTKSNFTLDKEFIDELDKLKYNEYIEEHTEFSGLNTNI